MNNYMAEAVVHAVHKLTINKRSINAFYASDPTFKGKISEEDQVLKLYIYIA